MRLELRQTHGAVASGEVPGHRTEGEERERVEQTGTRRVALRLGGVRVRRVVPQDDVVGGGEGPEGAVEALGEKAEEEVNGGGDYDGGRDDDNHYNDGRRSSGGRGRRR